MTVSELLCEAATQLTAAGLDDAESVSEVLLAHTLRVDPMALLSSDSEAVSDSQTRRYRELIAKACEMTPPQYLTGQVSFFGQLFDCDPRALIPRPDTETLVRATLERCEDDLLRVLDYGTGTGCVAISLKLARPNWLVSGADQSEDALELAADNLKRHELVRGVNLFRVSSLRGSADSEWDVIVSNPPYVSAEEYQSLDRRVKDYEPEDALLSGEDGLDLIRHLIDEGTRVIRLKGWLLLEIGCEQGARVRDLFERSGYDQVEVLQDPSGLDRVEVGRNARLEGASTPSDGTMELDLESG